MPNLLGNRARPSELSPSIAQDQNAKPVTSKSDLAPAPKRAMRGRSRTKRTIDGAGEQ